MWDNRVRVEWISPGPGEYNTIRRTGHGQPMFAFGVKAPAPRPKLEPGPGQYKLPRSCNGQLSGNLPCARIGKNRSKSALDWEIYRASKLPGPLDYETRRPLSCPGIRMAEGKALSELDLKLIEAAKTPGPMSYKIPDPRVPCVKITEGKPKGYLDWAIYRGKQCPGPQDYDADYTKIRQQPPRVKITQSKAKTDVEWQCYKAKQEPGPGEYEVDCSFSSGPHGSKNSNKHTQNEAAAISKVACKGRPPRDTTQKAPSVLGTV